MANNTIEVQILASTEAATKAIKDFSENTQKQLGAISLATAATAIIESLHLIEEIGKEVFSEITKFIGESVAKAAEAEQAQIKLASAMRVTGDFTNGAFENFKKLAEQISRTTVYSEEQVFSAGALAKTYQLTNREAENLIKASTNLAAATGTDLNSAVNSLALSYNGFVDKTIGRHIPALKALTATQLANGDAIAIVAKRFPDFAAAMGSTFQGSITIARHQFDQFQESLGNLVVQNPAIVAAIKVIGEAFANLTETFSKNKGPLGDIVLNAFKAMISLAPGLITAVKGIDFAFSNAIISVINFGRSLTDTASLASAIARGDLVSAKDAIQDLFKDLTKVSTSDFSGNSTRISSFYDPIIKAAQDASDKIQKITSASAHGQVATTKQLSEDQIKAARLAEVAALGIQKRIADILKNPISFLITPEVEAKLKLGIESQKLGALATSVTDSISKGAAGASSLVTGAFGAVADAFIPGIGGAVSQIASVLAQGPEKVKSMVEEFTKALPDVIKNIVLAIPVLITAMAKAIPQVIRSLTDALPEVISSLVSQMPQVATALALEAPMIAISFAEGLIKNLPDIVKSFASEFLKIPEQFAKALLDAINPLSGGSGSGKGGTIGSSGFLKGDLTVGRGIADVATGGLNELFGNPFGFAAGGRVANRAAFANDGLPAKLSAGEQVLGPDLSKKLEDYLNGGSSQTVVVQIGQQELARALVDLRRGGFRT